MKGIETLRCAPVLLVATLAAGSGSGQEVHTDLPAGLAFSQVLLGSGLPLDLADPEGWSAQRGGLQEAWGVGLYHSVLETSVRVPGVGVDSVRVALESTLRTALEDRGLDLVERPRPGGALPGNGGDSRIFHYRAPRTGPRGWVTLLVLPGEGDRLRVTVVSVEAREGAG